MIDRLLLQHQRVKLAANVTVEDRRLLLGSRTASIACGIVKLSSEATQLVQLDSTDSPLNTCLAFLAVDMPSLRSAHS